MEKHKIKAGVYDWSKDLANRAHTVTLLAIDENYGLLLKQLEQLERNILEMKKLVRQVR